MLRSMHSFAGWLRNSMGLQAATQECDPRMETPLETFSVQSGPEETNLFEEITGKDSSQGLAEVEKAFSQHIEDEIKRRELIGRLYNHGCALYEKIDDSTPMQERKNVDAVFFQFCFHEILSVCQESLNGNVTIPLQKITYIVEVYQRIIFLEKTNTYGTPINSPKSGSGGGQIKTHDNIPDLTYRDKMYQLLKVIFPIITWLPEYPKSNLKYDIVAGITVGILLIPQGISYSLIAGLPPIHGLYAAFIPLLVYTATGTSRHVAAGPMAIVSLMVSIVLKPFAEQQTERYIALSYILSFMVGAIMLTLGCLRVGFIASFLSQPIVSGYTSGASILIILGQLKFFLGIPLESSRLHEIIYEICTKFSSIDVPSVIFGGFNFAFLFFINKWEYTAHIPSASILLTIGLPVSYGLVKLGVPLPIIKHIPSGLPEFIYPDLNIDDMQMLIVPSIIISFVSYVSVITVARSFANRFHYDINPNQEFIAFGLSNLSGSFFQSFPMTGGLARTAVNVDAGAKSQLAGLFTAIFIGVLLAFLTPMFYYLPYTTLAAVIIFSLRNCINATEAKLLWKYDRHDFYVYSSAFLVTIFWGIIEGILSSIFVALFFVMFRAYNSSIQIMVRKVGTQQYIPGKRERDQAIVLHYTGELNFLNFSKFRDIILNEMSNHSLDHLIVVVDCPEITYIDGSAARSLVVFSKELELKKWKLRFSRCAGSVEKRLVAFGMDDESTFFVDPHHAVIFKTGATENDSTSV